MAHLRLMHFCEDPLEAPDDAAKTLVHLSAITQRPGPKPWGFWLSNERGEGWKQWCRSESFRPRSLAYEYYVKLTGKERILYLRSARDIDKFTAEYKADSEQNRWSDKYDRDNPSPYRDGPTVFEIDWARVAEKYQGIIITPYVWSRRLTTQTMWYYGWDCASGCIWDAAAISRFKLKTVHWRLLEEYNPSPDEERQALREMMKDMGKSIEVLEKARKDMAAA